MRVVVAHNRYSSAQPSGENRVVEAEVELLRAAGVDVVELCRSSDEIRQLPPGRRALVPLGPVYAPQRDLRQLLHEHRPDVLHLHNPYPLLSPWVVRTAHAAGVPVVQTVHNYRHTCVSGVEFRDGRPCTDCRGWRLPVPAVVHGCYRGSRPQSLAMATGLAVHRPTWQSVDRFVAPSAPVADYLRRYGVPEHRIVVRPNPWPDPGPPPPSGDGFLFLGRLTPEKGVAALLDAWRRHPDGSLGPLRIAGDGPLRAQVEAHGRRDVHVLGPLDPAGVRAALAACAVVVVPSLWPDVLPTVVLEALAAGRPVLGTAMGGIPYAVGAAGWTVPPTVDGLADGLTRARLEAAGRGGAALGEAARQRYETTFHPDAAVADLVGVYTALAR